MKQKLTWQSSALIFFLSLVVFLTIFSRFENLHGGDGYYHLSLAREYWRAGFFDSLSWARFSAMNDHFGDKEFLFHLLLMPFVRLAPSHAGANLALAFFNALVFTIIAFLSVRAIGKWGVFVPVLLFGTSAAFTLRLTSLRPEILSLILLLLATWVASRKRYFWLFVVSGLYALSYTAFHALLGLSLGWFVYTGWITRKWDWRIPLYTALGIACGLALHPNFPSNCQIWWIQNVDFFRYKAFLPVGREIYPHTTATALEFNFGWLLGLILFWRSVEKRHPESTNAGPEAFFFVNAIAFSLLYISMQRFSTYCMPFVTLALLFEIKRRGLAIGRWFYLPWRGRIPFSIAFCLCLALSMNSCWWVYYNLKQHGVFTTSYSKQWREFAFHLPEGARVAAPWAYTELYVWAAPRARYLNVLDPVFMAVANPGLYGLQRSIWANRTPDVPLAVRTFLDSEYIVFPAGKDTALFRKLVNDPRVELRHRGMDAIFYIKPRRPDRFVLDWRFVQDMDRLPLKPGAVTTTGFEYPRLPRNKGRAVEAYVDANRINKQSKQFHCFHIEHVVKPVSVTYELASYGPATFRHNGEKILEIGTSPKAELGKGVLFTLYLEKGRHLYSVSTRRYDGNAGFYLMERNRSDSESHVEQGF